MHVFHYRDKVHMLQSPGATTHVKTSYARVATVVKDLFQSLRAGLSNDDVLCMAQVCNLEGWSTADMTESRK